MLLGDWGADIVRVVRKGPDGAPADLHGDAQLRNRTVVAANLKDRDDLAALRAAIRQADVFIEGFRPGVAERLGVGPAECLNDNPGLIYARMTGWGQDGPMAQMAGHDINYLSITGMLDAIGGTQSPVVPLNLLGDFGGGSMFLLSGVLAALLERTRSGRGQVLDIAIVDGINTLAQMIWSFRHMGIWTEQRNANILDGGAPYYGVYVCADGKHIAAGAIEQPFYSHLLNGLCLDAALLPDRDDRASWPELREILAAAFLSKTRDQWTEIFHGSDACVTPVLSMTEVLNHPHIKSRNGFGTIDSIVQPLPAQMFSRSAPAEPTPAGQRTAKLSDIARRWHTD